MTAENLSALGYRLDCEPRGLGLADRGDCVELVHLLVVGVC